MIFLSEFLHIYAMEIHSHRYCDVTTAGNSISPLGPEYDPGPLCFLPCLLAQECYVMASLVFRSILGKSHASKTMVFVINMSVLSDKCNECLIECATALR